ncbi:MAG: leucine-rich repeat domain-containing protein [Treponema sp.]|nr:leucine-rich repeat domain-containing protein [Treponema sp.]
MTRLTSRFKIVAVALLALGAAAFAKESLEIPDNVTGLEYGAYRNRKDIVLVTIPWSVTSIDKDAFKNCPNLLGVTFDDEDNWYITQDETNWQKKMMGTHIDVSDSSTNAFALSGNRYYFYKLEDE